MRRGVGKDGEKWCMKNDKVVGSDIVHFCT
jgi:hypothetical protein